MFEEMIYKNKEDYEMKRFICLLCASIFVFNSCTVKEKNEDNVLNIPAYDAEIVDTGNYLAYYNGIDGDDSGIYIYGENFVDTANFITVDLNTGDTKNKSVSGDYIYEPYNYFDNDIYSNGYRYDTECDTVDTRMKKDGWNHIVSTYIDSSGTVYKAGYNSKGASVSVSDNKGDAVKIKALSEITGDTENELFVQDIIAVNENILLTYFEMEYIGESKEYRSYIGVLDSNLNLIKLNEITELTMVTQISYGWENTILLSSEEKEGSAVIAWDYNTLEYSSPLVLDDTIRIFDSEKPEVLVYYDFKTKTLNSFNLKNGNAEEMYAVPQEYEFADFKDSQVMMKQNTDELISSVIKISDDLSVSEYSERSYYKAAYDELTEKYSFFYGNKFLFKTERNYTSDFMAYCSEKAFIVSDGFTADIYEIQGNCINQMDFSDMFNVTFLVNKFKTACVYEENNKLYYSEIDTDTARFKNTTCLNDLNYNEFNGKEVFRPGDDNYDFYIISGDIAYAYSHSENQILPVIDVSDEKININDIYSYDDCIYVVPFYCNQLYVYKSKDSSEQENSGSTESDIPVIRISESLCSIIAEEYAAETGKFKIETIDNQNCSNYGIEIYAEDIPDILITNSFVNVNNLEKMGAFEDLSAYIEKDLYMDNVLEAVSENGGIYRLPLNYYCWTWAASDISFINDKKWDYSSFKEVCDNHSAPELFISNSKNDIADMFLVYSNRDFVSVTNRNNNYDSDEFITLLDAINNYGVEDKDNIYNYDPIIEEIKLFGPESIDEYENKRLIGIPSSNGGESWIFTSLNISISARSQNKELCIEILNRMLQEDSLDRIADQQFGFSILKSKTEEKLDKLEIRTNPTYAEECKKLIFNSNKEIKTNKLLMDTVNEELALFFSGGQSAEETAEIIKRKVSLHFDEIN